MSMSSPTSARGILPAIARVETEDVIKAMAPETVLYKISLAYCYNDSMPRISEFFGIVIKMFYNDHSPAHFHAEYGEFEAIYTIETMEVLRGELPRRAHAMVLEWTTLHRMELKDNWEMARQGLPLTEISPLD